MAEYTANIVSTDASLTALVIGEDTYTGTAYSSIVSAVSGGSVTAVAEGLYSAQGTIQMNGDTLVGDEGAIIANNTAITNFAVALEVKGSGNVISGMTFYKNVQSPATTGNFGGPALWNGASSLTVNSSVFDGNVATNLGGAIRYTASSTATFALNDSVLTGNTSRGGGALYLNLAEMTISGTEFSSNKSTANAGAI